ncbi:ACT domain-containing protein [Rufibacter sediminis]|uniref:ACT domain-containing protein n=1 Tax=Rufibacter sediminis TaxID=2762756 RepID=A0ABR6VPD4_9BACT|nr:ACT domain-containing protein [Rufibacter sediminis]MBC3539056.1 ACT domain-containing protein [Rufibacter sediminis]
MTGETDLAKMLRTLEPRLNPGAYVFCVVQDMAELDLAEVLMMFREGEGTTVILKKDVADRLQLAYSFIAAWITLSVHSSLEAVGLTAVFSKTLAKHGISCNVVAAYYHDHIFVNQQHAAEAMRVLTGLSTGNANSDELSSVS